MCIYVLAHVCYSTCMALRGQLVGARFPIRLVGLEDRIQVISLEQMPLSAESSHCLGLDILKVKEFHKIPCARCKISKASGKRSGWIRRYVDPL